MSVQTGCFSGRTALVTGGARRVGLAIACAVAGEGASVIITFNRSNGAEVQQALEQIRSAGAPEVAAHQCDLGLPESIDELTRSLDETHAIDLLVNSAASFTRESFFDATVESFDATIALNLRGPFFLTRALAAGMKRRGFGRIVNLVDVAAMIPWPSYLAYSISKGGLITMTRGLAKTLAPDVLVNCVAPGPVMLPEEYDPEESRRAIEPTLLKRAGSPADVAGAAVFLLASDYITGITLPVDGGRLLR